MWFEDLMGFPEESPAQVRANIELDGAFLVSKVNGARVRYGMLTTPSLDDLREGANALPNTAQPTHLDEVVGDVITLHRDPANAGALFQAASQFNLLEMSSPQVTPEQGVGIYQYDKTQGPSCAIACGGGAIYRNYFAAVDGQQGQSATQQIDCLAQLGAALGQPGLYTMQNGYALANTAGLKKINAQLEGIDETERERLKGLVQIGVQHEAEVLTTQHQVSQAYCSALPVAYGRPPKPLWEPFARLVLEATYEATLLIAKLKAVQRVFLTRVGGGVFGNGEPWIDEAIAMALKRVPGLHVSLVSYGQSHPANRALVKQAQGL